MQCYSGRGQTGCGYTGTGMVPFEQLAPRLSSPQRLPSTIALGKKNNYNAVCIVLSLFFPLRKIKDYR